ncbi:kinase-like domain-containing protein [Mycotypha africana]|uniref:kinase-like domain-containing protein n=1 Tax=Mycotypha africana TaxID=64632 RepID=UPI0023003E55|nr:kinase-like domain-containing protein [Mycotypha africana]KAI8971791.1 kinase-like domain-containing protein [Mycotypha africana]
MTIPQEILKDDMTVCDIESSMAAATAPAAATATAVSTTKEHGIHEKKWKCCAKTDNKKRQSNKEKNALGRSFKRKDADENRVKKKLKKKNHHKKNCSKKHSPHRTSALSNGSTHSKSSMKKHAKHQWQLQEEEEEEEDYSTETVGSQSQQPPSERRQKQMTFTASGTVLSQDSDANINIVNHNTSHISIKNKRIINIFNDTQDSNDDSSVLPNNSVIINYYSNIPTNLIINQIPADIVYSKDTQAQDGVAFSYNALHNSLDTSTTHRHHQSLFHLEHTPPLQYKERPKRNHRNPPMSISQSVDSLRSDTSSSLSSIATIALEDEDEQVAGQQETVNNLTIAIKREAESEDNNIHSTNNTDLISQKYVQIDESNILPNIGNQRYATRRRAYRPPAKKIKHMTEGIQESGAPSVAATHEEEDMQQQQASTLLEKNLSHPTVAIRTNPSSRQSKLERKLTTFITPPAQTEYKYSTEKKVSSNETFTTKPTTAPTNGMAKKPKSKQPSKIAMTTATTLPACSNSQKRANTRNLEYAFQERIEGSLQLQNRHLIVSDVLIGEGQFGAVRLGTYKGLEVACKMKRDKISHAPFEAQAIRELQFAAKLSACRYVNRYIGWTYCQRHVVEESKMHASKKGLSHPRLYIIQNYVSNGDARTYLNKRMDLIQPQEVLQAAICLFSTLADAHSLNIGIVDLKLENFLIDSSGTGWVTDFGSCIEFREGQSVIHLDKEGVSWTKNVASPEMLRDHEFCKASDVFMASLIIAELMTAELSDSDFYHHILGRNRHNGTVNFSSKPINRKFAPFFYLLKKGLANEPSQRPSATDILNYLLKMRV